MKPSSPLLLLLGWLGFWVGPAVGTTYGQGTQPQILTWIGTTNQFLDLNVPYALEAESDRGLPVTVGILTGPATMRSGLITVTNAGTVWVRAEQPGSGRTDAAVLERSFNMREVFLTEVGRLEQSGDARFFDVAGGFAYLPDGRSGLRIVDVRDASHPVQAGLFSDGSFANSVKVMGGAAYVANWSMWDGSRFRTAGLSILDVSDPSKPSRIGLHFTDANFFRFDVAGNYAYIPQLEKGLIALDLTDPSRPLEAPVPASAGTCTAVAVANSHVYATYLEGDLRVFEAGESGMLSLVGTGATGSRPTDVRVVGTHAFLASESGWPALMVMDVSDPRRPTLTAQPEVYAPSFQLEVADNYAYTASGEQGLLAVDISNPVRPTWSGGIKLPMGVYGAKVVGDHAYASSQDGLHIFEIHKAYANPLGFNPPSEIAVTNRFIALPQTSGNGKQVTYTVLEGPARISGGLLVFTGTGLVRLRAAQPDDGLFHPVNAIWSIDIRKAPIAAFWTGATNEFLTVNQPYPLGAVTSDGRPLPLKVLVGPAVFGNGAVTATNLGTIWVTVDEWGDPDYYPALEPRRFNFRRATLSEIGSVANIGNAVKVRLQGEFGFVACEGGGLQIVNVSNPLKPVHIGTAQEPGGVAKDVRLVGTTAYVADGPKGLQIYDVSDPANPRKWSEVPVGTNAVGVDVVGNLAYVADLDAGVQVVNVANPSKPVLLGGVKTPGQASGLWVVGTTVYVADGKAGLTIIDASDPTRLQVIGGAAARWEARSLVIVGKTAFTASNVGWLTLFDVGDPREPKLLERTYSFGDNCGLTSWENLLWLARADGLVKMLDISRPTSAEYAFFDSLDLPVRDMTFAGDLVYVAAGLEGLKALRMRYLYENVLDFSPPATLSFSDGPLALPATSSTGESVLFSVASGPGRVVDHSLVFTGIGRIVLRAEQRDSGLSIPYHNEWEVEIVRGDQRVSWTGTTNTHLRVGAQYLLGAVSNSGLPVEVRVVAGPATFANGVIRVTGPGTVWVAAEQRGNENYHPLNANRAFNYKTVTLTQVGEIEFEGSGAKGVRVADGYAFVAKHQGGLEVVDVSHPARPRSVASIPNPNGAEVIALAGRTLYLSDLNGFIQIVDISDPTHLATRGGVPLGVVATDIAVQGGYAFVGTLSWVLRVLDVRDPARPSLAATIFTGAPATGVAGIGNRLYLADWSDWLRLVDITLPESPVLQTPILVGGPPPAAGSGFGGSRIDLAGGFAYVTRGSFGLEIYNVGNPSSIVRVGAHPFHGFLRNVRYSAGYVFVATEFSGLEVLDVNRPASPLPVGNFPIELGPYDMDVAADFVYVTTHHGLKILSARIDYPNSFNFEAPREIPITNRFLTLPQTAGNGRPIQYLVSAGPGRVDGDRLFFTGPGEVRLWGGQMDDGASFPESAEWPILISLLPQNLTWSAATNRLPFSHSLLPLPTAESGLPVTVTVVAGPARVEGGGLALTGLGAVTLRAEQAGNGDYLPGVAQWTTEVTMPELGVRMAGDEVEISWPAGLEGIRLQVRGSLSDASGWKDAPVLVTENEGLALARLGLGAGENYYRLVKE